MLKIVVVSGYFNPAHRGHLQLINAASKLGDTLIAIVNNDHQVKLKGSVPFMAEADRLEMVGALRPVHKAVLAIDDDRSVSKTIEYLHNMYKISVFANGGDATPDIVREREVCEKLGIEMIFGVGGDDKVQSSSNLIKAAQIAAQQRLVS